MRMQIGSLKNVSISNMGGCVEVKLVCLPAVIPRHDCNEYLILEKTLGKATKVCYGPPYPWARIDV